MSTHTTSPESTESAGSTGERTITAIGFWTDSGTLCVTGWVEGSVDVQGGDVSEVTECGAWADHVVVAPGEDPEDAIARVVADAEAANGYA